MTACLPLAAGCLSFGVPSILSITATYLVLRYLFRKDFGTKIEGTVEPHPLSGNGKMVLVGLGLMVAVLLTASSLDKDLGLPTCLAALAITVVVSIKARSNPMQLVREISWNTLALVAGLFILVDAVKSIGALQLTQAALHWVQKLAPALGALITRLCRRHRKQPCNNLPLGLIAGSTLHRRPYQRPYCRCCPDRCRSRPNLSITGSLATILWLLALRKEKLEVGFWPFLR